MADDRRKPDGVSTYTPNAHDRELIPQAQHELAQFSVPVMLSRSLPHDRLYIAAFDGTGNDRSNPEKGPQTNVGLIYGQIEQLKTRGDKQIGGGYVAGPGTQTGFLSGGLRDKISGETYDQRLEEMYFQFVTQAEKWLQDDPKAQIRIANLGFSRGAEQAAGFARLVEERGIWNPAGMNVIRGDNGLIERLEPTRPPLAPPGRTAQALALFDPVGTGVPYQRDRRPPPTVITGFQIKAEDDARDQFLSTHILDKGRTHGDRFLRVLMPGAHSDVGGGYVQDGLPRINGNLMIDYLNSLCDKPFLTKLPLRPDMERIHRSEEGKFVYSTGVMETRTRNGFGESENRGFVESIGGNLKDKSAAAMDAEPRNERLNAQFERQNVRIGPVPPGRIKAQGRDEEQQGLEPARHKQNQDEPKQKSFLDSIIDRLSQGAIDKDDKAMSAAVSDYMRSPLGQQFQAETTQQSRILDAEERQAALEMQQLAQHEAMRNPHVMRM
jgi:hypothetical protein